MRLIHDGLDCKVEDRSYEADKKRVMSAVSEEL